MRKVLQPQIVDEKRGDYDGWGNSCGLSHACLPAGESDLKCKMGDAGCVPQKGSRSGLSYQ